MLRRTWPVFPGDSEASNRHKTRTALVKSWHISSTLSAKKQTWAFWYKNKATVQLYTVL